MTKQERLQDIREHPERHRHPFVGLVPCCIVDGVIDTQLMQAHEGVTGRSNGGVRCDVIHGPCSCGAWH